MLREYARLAFGSLSKRLLRTSLTLLGIFIGITAVVALVSLGQGLDNAITAQFEKVGSDKLFIRPKGSFTSIGVSEAANVTEDDLFAIRKVAGVKEAAGHIAEGASISLDEESVPVVVGSLPDDETQQLVAEAHTYEIERGRWFRPGETDAVVIGNDFSRKELLERTIDVGDKVRINGHHVFEVVGVLKRVGAPDADEAVFLGEDALRATLDVPDDVFSAIIARIEPGAVASDVQERVERAVRREHGVDEGEEDFEVQSPDDLLRVFNTILDLVQVLVVSIASISLLVGGINITNTMYTAVLERRREIGVMKAVGADRRAIFLVFLIESAILGLAGGVVGVAMGVFISKSVEIAASVWIGSPLIRAEYPWWLLFGTLFFTLIIGIISGVTPANRASRLPPVEALRG